MDESQRRAHIAEAVFTLIEQRGVEAVSLRAVADQAELNVGSVRHYVQGSEGMLLDAVRHMEQRVAARLEERGAQFAGIAADDIAGQTELALDLLEELLPIDEGRRREVAVWLAFSDHSRTHPELAEAARALLAGSRELCRALLVAAGVRDEDVHLASEALAATVDGLALALLHEPDRLTRAERRAILAAHLHLAVNGPRARG